MGLLRLLATGAAFALALGIIVSTSSGAAEIKQHRVSLRVAFRAFCPACQWFIGYPLLELLRIAEFRNIVDLTLIPAGGMKVKQDRTITCEAGPLECTGHRWQVCVLDKDRNDVIKYLGTIACIEGDESGPVGEWATKMKNCVTDEERVVLTECFDNRSEDLLIQMIRDELSESIPWMPYTLVNQKVLGSASEGVPLRMLKTNICSAYTGPKSLYPKECIKLVGEQKIFAPESAEVENEKSPVVAEEKSQASIAPENTALHTEAEPPRPADIHENAAKDLEEAIPAPIKALGKVRMDLYWRAFCPGCTSFITRPLLSLIRNKEFQEVIDFRPVPAAGTSYDANGHFVCASGRLECHGHKWLSCAVEEFQQVGELVEHIACMESKDNKGMTWRAIIKRCFEGEKHTKMKTCYAERSDELLRKNLAKRQAIHIPWVPYVVLNGAPLGDSTHGIGLKQLTDAVCQALSGSNDLKPAVCVNKRLRDETEPKAPAEDDVVKPCPSKNKVVGNAGAQYDDAPRIGKPLSSEPEAQTITEYDAKVIGGRQVDYDRSSATIAAIILPGVCFVVLIFIALRLSRGHRKDA